VEEKKALGRAPVQWPSARDGGRRIGASADFGRPSGTLFSSARLQLLSRGGWCWGYRGGHRIASASTFAAAGLAVDGSRGSGPMRASAPTGMPRTCA